MSVVEALALFVAGIVVSYTTYDQLLQYGLCRDAASCSAQLMSFAVVALLYVVGSGYWGFLWS